MSKTSCTKQFPLNFAPIRPLRFRAKLLPYVTGFLKLSSDNSLDYHAETLLVPVNIRKYLKTG